MIEGIQYNLPVTLSQGREVTAHPSPPAVKELASPHTGANSRQRQRRGQAGSASRLGVTVELALECPVRGCENWPHPSRPAIWGELILTVRRALPGGEDRGELAG